MPDRRPAIDARAGFSLIEALVVLAIGGMAMMLVFGIGSRATETGFRLGRTALGRADATISTESYRSLVEGLVLAPKNGSPETFRVKPVTGAATALEADAVLARGGACAPAGPARDLRLQIVEGVADDRPQWRLQCAVGQREPVTVLSSPSALAFSYSEDGVAWSDVWTNDVDIAIADDGTLPLLTEQRLFVRLTNADGAIEVVGMARSGRPALYFARGLDGMQ